MLPCACSVIPFNPQTDQCRLEDIPPLWEKHAVLTLLVDIRPYRGIGCEYLDEGEKTRVKKFKSRYFRERFVVSRTILKIILAKILRRKPTDEIILSSDGNGRIRITGEKNIFLCLSYSGDIISLTIARVQIGTDIERIRPVPMPSAFNDPIFKELLSFEFPDPRPGFLNVWTFLEAYCKCLDRDLYSVFRKEMDFTVGTCNQFILGETFLLSFVTLSGNHATAIRYLEPLSSLARPPSL